MNQRQGTLGGKSSPRLGQMIFESSRGWWRHFTLSIVQRVTSKWIVNCESNKGQIKRNISPRFRQMIFKSKVRWLETFYLIEKVMSKWIVNPRQGTLGVIMIGDILPHQLCREWRRSYSLSWTRKLVQFGLCEVIL